MANLNKKDEKLSEFQTALQNLKESEVAYAVAAARYAELESIVRKQLRSQFVEGSDSLSRTESDTSCKADTKSVNSYGSSSKNSVKSMKNTLTKPPTKLKKRNETSDLLVKKSSTDICRTSPEPPGRSQLLKRIRQCHDSVEDVALLSDKNVSQRKKFVIRLDRLNYDSWKSQRAKHSVVGKLEMHLEK